ncbi:MAG: hypothetical protein LBS91_01515, partial [Clostridiales Family XIII bacterium]|nr:hypothetical protein [Clostridiales Family XIII bacterium]
VIASEAKQSSGSWIAAVAALPQSLSQNQRFWKVLHKVFLPFFHPLQRVRNLSRFAQANRWKAAFEDDSALARGRLP